MKRTIITLMAAVLGTAAIAQTADKPKAKPDTPKVVSVKPYGFVRNYFTYDSRNMYTVIGGEYDMLPYDKNVKDGVDLNEYANAKFLAITTRFGLNLAGPEVWGARTTGKIEADFGGFSTNNHVLRIRLAYVKLNWNHANHAQSELLMGQDWHPLSGSIMPDALGMAAGAPFRPHSRTPQVRYAYTLPNGLGATASLLYQLQFMYNGPSTNDITTAASTAKTDFANNAVLPEAFVGLNYKNNALYAQLGVDVQPIRPRNFAVDASGVTHQVGELFTTFTPTLYVQYVDGMFGVKFRTLLAQNTSHVNQLNGYAVSGYDPITGEAEYTPLRATISYLNISYGKQYKANLFLGYMKNLGAADDLYDFSSIPGVTTPYQIFMKGGADFTHLNSIWRVAPAFSYNLKHFNIGLEYELTGATYGDWDKDGSILDNDNLHQVLNHRICALVKYNF